MPWVSQTLRSVPPVWCCSSPPPWPRQTCLTSTMHVLAKAGQSPLSNSSCSPEFAQIVAASRRRRDRLLRSSEQELRSPTVCKCKISSLTRHHYKFGLRAVPPLALIAVSQQLEISASCGYSRENLSHPKSRHRATHNSSSTLKRWSSQILGLTSPVLKAVTAAITITVNCGYTSTRRCWTDHRPPHPRCNAPEVTEGLTGQDESSTY